MHSTIGKACEQKPIFNLLKRLLVVVALVVSGSAQATDLIIVGVEGELANNVRLLIGNAPSPEDSRKFQRYVNSLNEQAANALGALGYYSAEITVSTKAATAENPATITLDINANSPVRINKSDVRVQTATIGDLSFEPIVNSLGFTPGAVFVSSEYEAAKTKLVNAAQDLGYFDFEFTSSKVAVSRRKLTADITLLAQSGKRYSFGAIQFDTGILSGTFLRRWLPFATGDPYESSLVGELTQNLQNSGYFDGVRVKPIIDPRYSRQKVVPVRVQLTRKDNNEIAVGFGYATDTKLRTKLTWAKPLINSNGHSAEFSLGLSRDRKSAGFSYRIPRNKQPLYNYWGLEYGVKNENDEDTESLLSKLNLQYATRTRGQWTESRFLRWEKETFKTGGEEDSTDLLLPGISYSRSRSEGSPFPVRGQAITFQLMGGSKRFVSTIDIIKTLATFRYLRAVSPRNTLIGSIQYGAIQSNDYDRVPVSQRFFAGGDRSIRGFAYRQLTPRNQAGEALGGRYLEVLSAEYNYRFKDRWSAAVFADAGRAFNDADTGYSVGAGVGIRWQSPVGPFRIDVAAPVSDDDEGGVRVHLSLGPDL